MVDKRFVSAEISVGRCFSESLLASKPRNHCVSFLEVIRPPEDSTWAIVVMPMLESHVSSDLKTVADTLELLRQAFEVFKTLTNAKYS